MTDMAHPAPDAGAVQKHLHYALDIAYRMMDAAPSCVIYAVGILGDSGNKVSVRIERRDGIDPEAIIAPLSPTECDVQVFRVPTDVMRNIASAAGLTPIEGLSLSYTNQWFLLYKCQHGELVAFV